MYGALSRRGIVRRLKNAAKDSTSQDRADATASVATAALRVALTMAAALLVTIAATPRQALAQVVVGTISALDGDVTLQRGPTSLKPNQGMDVDLDDTLTTAAASKVTVTLTDGSRIELNESTTAVIDGTASAPKAGTPGGTNVSLLGGLMRSFVNNAGGPTLFQVSTPNAVAAVRGTIYDTDYQNGVDRPGFPNCKEFTDIIVYENTVTVSNPTNPGAPPVDVHEGQETHVPCAGAPLEPSATGAAGGAGLGTAAIVGGAAVAAGGVAGGLAAGGVFGGGPGNAPPKKPVSPAQ